MKCFAVTMMMVILLVGVAAATGFKSVPSIDAQQVMEKNKNIFLLDVRTPDEFRQARLKGAVLIPLSDIERRIGEVPRNRPVLVYCAVGSRSGAAAGFLASKGYRDVYNMTDGLVGWYRRGLPLER